MTLKKWFSLTIGLLIVGTSSYADSPPSNAADRDDKLEEIVVTAQRRERNFKKCRSPSRPSVKKQFGMPEFATRQISWR